MGHYRVQGGAATAARAEKKSMSSHRYAGLDLRLEVKDYYCPE
ncbi:MAG: hypothetical protein WC364_15290 [Eubacteriales bacterium]